MMKIAVCYNEVPPRLRKGEAADRISEAGSASEAQAVSRVLKALGHESVLVPVGADIATFIAALRKEKPTLVFNLCEGFWGDSSKEMHMAALLELLDIPYTGSGPLCLGLTQDKARTKDLLARHQLPTPPYLLVEPGAPCPSSRDHNLAYPLMVKPRSEDASLGITADSIVADAAALAARVTYIHITYRQAALVEEFIDGREINAAIFGNTPAESLPLAEIEFRPGLLHPIVTYDGKWLEESSEYRQTVPVCPALLDTRTEQRIKDVALSAYQLLNCRDYARVDIRLRDGQPYILEINANPDISPDAGLTRAASAAGYSYPQVIASILTMALTRKELTHAQP
ncbi:MAG TPA: D-alanine--D-alanine ligase [Desulfuromonas sp.]|nr:D-alanine--D-alanine ligase [Desulfuromonas sp.]